MPWTSTITITAASAWDAVSHLATLSNVLSTVSLTLAVLFVYLAGSKAQREAIAKATQETIDSLSSGIKAATMRADAEEARADAATHRAEAEKKRADDAEASALAEAHRADLEAHRADSEKQRADQQTLMRSTLEVKNAELLNSSTADQTRFLASLKAVAQRNVELEAENADLKVRLAKAEAP